MQQARIFSDHSFILRLVLIICKLLSISIKNALENFKVNYRELGLCWWSFSCKRVLTVANLFTFKYEAF